MRKLLKIANACKSSAVICEVYSYSFSVCFNRKERKESLGELELLACLDYPVFLCVNVVTKRDTV